MTRSERLLKIFREEGAASIRHKARGRSSHNRIRDGLRAYAMALVRESYADFGPTLAAEKLAEQDGVQVSRGTLRIGSVRALEHHDLWSYAQTDGEVSFTGPVARRGQLVDVGSAS